LQEKGVNITEPKKQDWGGIMSQIKDQDNNILTLISSYEDHDHNNNNNNKYNYICLQ
jgi:hypothetical protein